MMTENILKLNFTGEILIFDFEQKGKLIRQYKERVEGRLEGILININ